MGINYYISLLSIHT